MSSPSTPYLLKFNVVTLLATYAVSALLGLQICLSIHALAGFSSLSHEQRAGRRRYASTMLTILVVSSASAIVFSREPYRPLIDSRWDQELVESVQSRQQTLASAGVQVFLSLMGAGFMIWRAVVTWSDTFSLKLALGMLSASFFALSLVSVCFQAQALAQITTKISEFPPPTLSDTIVAKAVRSIQDKYNFWVKVQFLGAVAVVVFSSTLIVFRFLLERKTRLGIPEALLDSGLPFALAGLIGVFVSGRKLDILWPAVKSLDEDWLPSVDIAHLANNLWVISLVLGCQFILFRLLAGQA